VILRGWPVAIFIRVYGEREAEDWFQTISRFTTVSPRMTVEKYREAIRLKSLAMGTPGHLLVERLGLDREKWAQTALKIVSKRLTEIKTKVREKAGRAKASMFWIPFYRKIGEEFPAEIGRRMRDAERFLVLMQAHAALNVFNRPRLVYKDGTEYIVVVREDYEEAVSLYFSEEDKLTILTGLPKHVLEFFRKVVKPLWSNSKTGLTVRELVDGTVKLLGKTLSDNTIRRHYIRQLENAGFVSFEENPEDRREKIVRVLKEDFEKITGNSVLLTEALNFTFEELKEAWNELIQIRAHKSGENNTLFSSNEKIGEVPKLVDPSGRELTLEELYKTYYFDTGFRARIETSENRASFEEKSQKKYEIKEKHENARNLVSMENPSEEAGKTCRKTCMETPVFPASEVKKPKEEEPSKFNTIKKKYRVLKVLGETGFAGVCELCGKSGAEVVAELEDGSRVYTHRKCLEGE
jgi:hypothetical protein